jgi:hypothetical protein
MKFSVEVILYPLNADYTPAIDAFIDRAKSHDRVEVRCTDLSTQLFGDYDLIMDLLKEEVRATWDAFGDGAFVLKLLPGDLRGIAPDSKPDSNA